MVEIRFLMETAELVVMAKVINQFQCFNKRIMRILFVLFTSLHAACCCLHSTHSSDTTHTHKTHSGRSMKKVVIKVLSFSDDDLLFRHDDVDGKCFASFASLRALQIFAGFATNTHTHTQLNIN